MRTEIHVGLEIGTSKICAVVAECRADGVLRVLGVGEAPSRGVRKGEVVDFDNASQCVHEALSDAEEKSETEIESVWLAVSGSHIRSFNNRGAIAIPDDVHEISEQDVEEVEYKAQEVSLPKENVFLHSLVQGYYVDGQKGVMNPVGMLGSKLETDFHIIHGMQNRIQNAVRCVRECQVKIEGIAVNSLASAQVVLDQKQKEAGALVIDIGGGVTDFITYLDGAVHNSGVLAVGGDHINSDISSRFRIPASRAEKLKIGEGSAILGHSGEGEKIVIKNDTGFAGMQIDREDLNYVIHVRFEEIFHLVKKQVYGAVPEHLIGAGVMLTGGGSLTRGIRELAESVFEIPVRLTSAKAVSGPTSAFENPRFSTAIGLVKYAQAFRAEMPEETVLDRVARWVSGWFQKSD